jgi:hypothetical protein
MAREAEKVTAVNKPTYVTTLNSDDIDFMGFPSFWRGPG